MGVNYHVFQRYLEFLQTRGLVTVTEGPKGERWVEMTSEGRSAHRRLVTWIRDVFGDSHLGRR